MTTRATCAAELRDEAETWDHLPSIYVTLNKLADILVSCGTEAALSRAQLELDAATTLDKVDAYQEALRMIYECEED